MSGPARLRLLIVDDHPVVRAGLRGMLETTSDFEVVGEAGDGEAAVREVLAVRPDLVLMDLRMPGVDGVEATRRIRSLPAPPPVLVLTTYESDALVLQAINAGAAGYMLKDARLDSLCTAIRSVVRGGAPLAPTVAARLADRAGRGAGEGGRVPSLRELEVLGLVAGGLSNSEIAQRLRLSEATVKTHLAHIFEKLEVADRTSAVTAGIGRGMIDIPADTASGPPAAPDPRADAGSAPVPTASAASLSPRELDVLRLLALGRSNGQIAAELCVTVGTSKAQVHAICRKLGAASRFDAVRIARAAHLLP